MVRMIAKEEIYYNGATRKKGETFETQIDLHADLLEKQGNAERFLETREMKAETPAPKEPRKPHDPKRVYKRRDMVSEDNS